MATLQATTIGGQTAWHDGNLGNIISRGNPGQGSPLLLSNIGDTHYYSASSPGNFFISTEMIENAVYELSYFSDGGTANQDFSLYPNYTTYGSQFRHYYWGSPGTPTIFDQTLNYVYFDHYGGGVGNAPNGTLTIMNFRNEKTYIYRGSDTGSVCMGTGSWNNNTTQWQYVGYLSMAALANSTVHVTVRRLS